MRKYSQTDLIFCYKNCKLPNARFCDTKYSIAWYIFGLILEDLHRRRMHERPATCHTIEISRDPDGSVNS